MPNPIILASSACIIDSKTEYIKTIDERDRITKDADDVKIILYSKSGCRLCDQLIPVLRSNYHSELIHVFKVDAIGADDVDFRLKKFPTLHIYKEGSILSELIQPSFEKVKKEMLDIIREDF